MFDSFVPSSGNTWDKSFNSSFTSECGNAEPADAITPGLAINNIPASGASGEVIDIPPAPASDFSLILLDTPLQAQADITTNRHETQAVDALTRQGLPAAVVGGAISSAHSALAEFASDPDFASKMNLAFGEGWDAAVAGDLARDWLTGDFSDLPPVEIRAGAEINGANGAFAGATNTIYLSSEFIAGNAGSPEAIASVLLEEMGHYIDSRINTSDAAGDEGAIFACAVQGKQFDAAELQALKAEDDTATVMLDGKAILIEQALPSTDNAWDIASGDNTRFDGAIWSGEVDERWRTSPELLQLYTDLSTAVLGQRFRMTAGYAYDQSYFKGQGKWHAGIDIGAPAGTSVKAALGGTVAWTWSSSTAGAFIGVNSSDGRQWVYGHLQGFGNFKQGSPITAGQTIGQVGNQSEAKHLHLEVRTPTSQGTFQGTNGASSNQNFILSATMSPLQAFWLRGNTIPSQPLQPSTSAFRGTVDGALNIRSGPGTNNLIVGSLSAGSSRTFDAMARGTTHWDAREQRNDDRWFRLSGTNQWVSAAFITGNPLFSGTADTTLNIRSGPGTNNSIVGSLSTGSSRTFDATTIGTTHWDTKENKNENRWFRLQGTDQWVSAANITGNPTY